MAREISRRQKQQRTLVCRGADRSAIGRARPMARLCADQEDAGRLCRAKGNRAWCPCSPAGADAAHDCAPREHRPSARQRDRSRGTIGSRDRARDPRAASPRGAAEIVAEGPSHCLLRRRRGCHTDRRSSRGHERRGDAHGLCSPDRKAVSIHEERALLRATPFVVPVCSGRASCVRTPHHWQHSRCSRPSSAIGDAAL